MGGLDRNDRLLFGRSLLTIPLLILMLLIGLTPVVMAAEEPKPTGSGYVGAEYWRQVTQGSSGYTPAVGQVTQEQSEAGVLINRSGETWRLIRDQTVKPAGQWALAGTVLVLLAIYAIFGSNKLAEPRTGSTVERWKRFDRYLHWLVAGLFIVLALTGLSILYGRHFMPDLIGKSGFAGWLALSKLLHNYLGPLFVLSLLVMLVKWVKNNLFNGHDLRWFSQGGGMIKGRHPHAGYMNGGEKLWFWIVALGGIAVAVSGLILDFPNYGQFRETMQTVNLVHAGASLVLVCGALAHIYIGTLGTEGALEGMVSGQVDESWAKQHHDLWFEQVKQGTESTVPSAQATETPSAQKNAQQTARQPGDHAAPS